VLRGIATMYVWRDELVTNFPLVFNGGLEFGTDFVVEDLEINVVNTVGEAVHDVVISGQSVFVRPVNIRGAEDCIAAAMGGNYDVLVAAASPDGESPGVVGVALGKWEVRDVELIGGGRFGGLVAGIATWLLSGWWSGVESGAKRFEDGGGLGLVERKPWCICLRWPLMVASEEGQCFIALWRVRPGKVLWLPALMAANQVNGTGLPAEVWWRQTRELTLGRSYALVVWGNEVGGGKGWD
jgi:hypothetical protein